MHRHQLPEQVGGQLADHQAVLCQGPADLIAIILAVCRQAHIEQALIPGRYLQRLESTVRSPGRDGWQAIERRRDVTELRQVQARSLEGFHRSLHFFVDRQRIETLNKVRQYVDLLFLSIDQ
jgi:hypothetical protein